MCMHGDRTDLCRGVLVCHIESAVEDICSAKLGYKSIVTWLYETNNPLILSTNHIICTRMPYTQLGLSHVYRHNRFVLQDI